MLTYKDTIVFVVSCSHCTRQNVKQNILLELVLKALHKYYEYFKSMRSFETYWFSFSLHHAAGAWEEVLDVSNCCLGQISHGSITATRGAIIEEVADTSGGVLFKEIITGTVGFLEIRWSKV